MILVAPAAICKQCLLPPSLNSMHANNLEYILKISTLLRCIIGHALFFGYLMAMKSSTQDPLYSLLLSRFRSKTLAFSNLIVYSAMFGNKYGDGNQ